MSIYDYIIKSGHVPHPFKRVYWQNVHICPRILAMPLLRSLVFMINNRHSLSSLNKQGYMQHINTIHYKLQWQYGNKNYPLHKKQHQKGQ